MHRRVFSRRFSFPRQALQHRCRTRSERHSACFLPNQAEPDRLPTVVQVLLLRHQAVFFRLKSVNMRSQAEPVPHFFLFKKCLAFKKSAFAFFKLSLCGIICCVEFIKRLLSLFKLCIQNSKRFFIGCLTDLILQSRNSVLSLTYSCQKLWFLFGLKCILCRLQLIFRIFYFSL